jgi:septum formation protein
MPKFSLHLASASPRRSALLHQLGLDHTIQPVDIDEAVHPGESPRDYVARLSAAKSRALFERTDKTGVTLGADTCVALDGEIFGKPSDEEDCVRILQSLSERTHEVHTAVTVCSAAGVHTDISVSQVEFRALSIDECRAYWRSGEPRDKAGAYAVQGRAALFIRRIAGSYSGIMGLPLFETAQLLARLGLEPTQLLSGEAA